MTNGTGEHETYAALRVLSDAIALTLNQHTNCVNVIKNNGFSAIRCDINTTDLNVETDLVIGESMSPFDVYMISMIMLMVMCGTWYVLCGIKYYIVSIYNIFCSKNVNKPRNFYCDNRIYYKPLITDYFKIENGQDSREVNQPRITDYFKIVNG